MPGDLQDPTQLFPYHNESRYDRPKNQFDPGQPVLVDDYVQGIAQDVIGRRLSPNELNGVKGVIEGKGLNYVNYGDQMFRDEISKYLKRMKMSKRVASKWLTSIS